MKPAWRRETSIGHAEAASARLSRALAGPAGTNLASTAAVGGHCIPLGLTGGKGVATSIGQVIGTFPIYLPLDAAVALATSALPLKPRRGQPRRLHRP
ncbi:MAG: glycerol-3-phosphate acyltransferase [Acidimicrobiia bacterium]|nr:glycerol-3-phosphate acyltransferase [Acidimicrobiia bacterium]